MTVKSIMCELIASSKPSCLLHETNIPLDVTYLCTDPEFQGRGTASALLRRVQAEAASENAPVILEATMNAVSFYQRFGFHIKEELDMVLPKRGSDEPTENYEERIMVWTQE